MPQRSGLGKGLDALIPGGSTAREGGAVQIPIDAIRRNPRQPRQSFKEDELEDLAASIREHGIIQPLIVSPALRRHLHADRRRTPLAGCPASRA